MAEVIERFPSSSSDAVHEVKDPCDGGPCWCTCTGWKMSKKQPKQCGHMLRLVKSGVLGADFVRGSTAPATPTPTAVAAAQTPVSKSSAAGAPQAMLAYPVEKAPRQPWGDDGWVAEVKIDGMRLFHVVSQDGFRRQFARSGNQRSVEFLNELPLPAGTVLDGELAAGEFGVYASGQTKDKFFLFDVLELGGRSLIDAPWSTRREVVEMLADQYPGVIHASTVLGTPEEKVVEQLFAMGGEGLMLKKKDGRYTPGKRSWTWLKAKGTDTYDVVIVDAEGDCTSEDRKAAGWKNLRYGVYKDGQLTVISSIGVTGLPADLAPWIGKVVEVKGWGQNEETGAIRHPQVIKVRDDKRPEECTI